MVHIMLKKRLIVWWNLYVNIYFSKMEFTHLIKKENNLVKTKIGKEHNKTK